MASKVHHLPMNPWEVRALDYRFSKAATARLDDELAMPGAVPRTMSDNSDSAFYPGLYSGTGFDMMSVLFRVMARPNPQIVLGPVDCSVALILCDLEKPDQPIVYVSDSFCEMTGYTSKEILGRNCRFLQTPPSSKRGVSGKDSKSKADKVAIRRMQQALVDNKEVQLRLVNYKKDGRPFNNFLSIIPITMDTSGNQYAVGFAVEVE